MTIQYFKLKPKKNCVNFKLIANFQRSIIISLEKKLNSLGKFTFEIGQRENLWFSFEFKNLNSYFKWTLMDTFHHIPYCSHEKSSFLRFQRQKKQKRIFSSVLFQHLLLQRASMTSLLTHTVAHFTRLYFRSKTNNHPLKKFLILVVSCVEVVKNWTSF